MRLRRIAAALAAAAALGVAAPARAASSVSFRVSVTYYGAAVAGGAGLLVYLSASWQALGGGWVPASSLLDVEGGRLRAGVPLPRPLRGTAPSSPGEPSGFAIDLLQVRF